VTSAGLHVQLDSELPETVKVGLGTAVFVCGWCVTPGGGIASLEFVLDGEPQPVDSYAMPRLDPLEALGEPAAYRSGFWGLVRIERPPADGAYALALRARLDDGSVAEAELGRIAVGRPAEPMAVAWPDEGAGARVAIAMATYDPPDDLLARQLDSIRAQSHPNWVCVISDDCSRPERYAAIERAVAGDPRFVLSRSERRRGFYGNFERALELVPGDAEYVALADQDDDWRPGKLAALLAELGDAQLVYSDARVVARDGQLISETWWNRRRNNHEDLLSLLVANSVTGAASLIRRELLGYVLPFPPRQFHHFHDHWIGVVARTLDGIAYVDAPLYDYVQHGAASLGHERANRMVSLRERLARQRNLRERVHMWRLHYFVDIWRLRQFCLVLLLRAGRLIDPDRRRVLEEVLDSDRSLRMLTVLGARGARELVSSKPETLGAEWGLFHALAWRRLLGLTAREEPQRRFRLDALPPPSLILEPGWAELDEDVAVIARKIAPLRWSVAERAPVRVNLLIPSIDLQHFFGGYIAKFNLARRLAARGFRVRVVTVDPVGPLPADWRRRVEAFAGLGGLFESVEVEFGRESSGIECSRREAFIATTWWTAHIARAALEQLDGQRFVYLIQEYEPFTFPMGTYSALARQSYDFPHFAVFSSELLRGWFREQGIGAFGTAGSAPTHRDSDSVSFQNAITSVAPPPAQELSGRRPRRLLFYARPEPHAARNMFELGVLALARALQDGAFGGDWEFNGIGSVSGRSRISLGRTSMRLVPRSDQSAYAELLRHHDVGLALMYTPHPSLVPLEMAAAGMVVVTNTFDNKDADAMRSISANIAAAQPTIEGVAEGLGAAAARADDAPARVAGADVNWARDWDEALPDSLLDRIVEALGV
jgi:glycosyltransferase involved in cell wall biosynthesis